MSYEHPRRSRRISKELSILLIGSDIDGKGFSEMTKTVVLSRHGAGVVSKYKLGAEQEIILRYLDTNKETVIRVVGQIGNQSDFYTYGVAFLDENTNFWETDFPPTSEAEKLARRALLECGSCKQQETVDQSETESDVLMVNEGIVRFCKNCGDSTFWKRISSGTGEQPASVAPQQESAAEQTPAPSSSATPAPFPSSAPPPSAPLQEPSLPPPPLAPAYEQTAEPSPFLTLGLSAPASQPPPPPPTPERKPESSRFLTLGLNAPAMEPPPTASLPEQMPDSSSFPAPASSAAAPEPPPPPPQSTSVLEQEPESSASPTPASSVAASEPPPPAPPPPPTPVVEQTPEPFVSPSPASSTAFSDAPQPAPPPAPAAQPKPKPQYANRRKHPRIKSTYKACIRRPGFPDDVVTCEDMSRGGICFKSRKRYYEMTSIDVAVPYSPNDQAIFIPGNIVWVQELANEKAYKCGVVYRLAAKTF
jgi:hypothetical protein